MSSSLLDFIFPKRSLSGVEGFWVTEDELRGMKVVSRTFSQSELQQSGVSHLDSLFAMSSYQASPMLKRAIASFKYRRLSGVGNVLASLFSETVCDADVLKLDGVLCPVPLYFLRQFRRGFNQASLFASTLSDASNVPQKSLLKRVRSTGSQKARKRQERLSALTGAFRFCASEVPHHVYLVDDVFTTGSTLEECAKVLKEAGVERVEGVVVAYD